MMLMKTIDFDEERGRRVCDCTQQLHQSMGDLHSLLISLTQSLSSSGSVQGVAY